MDAGLFSPLPDVPVAALTPPEPVFEGQAGARAVEPAAAKGRPKGSPNKISKDLVKLVQHQMGRHPLMELVRLYQMPLADLAGEFKLSGERKAGELRERLLMKLVDKTSPALAQVKFTDEKRLTVTFEGLDMGQQGALGLDDDLLEVTANDIKQLGGAS